MCTQRDRVHSSPMFEANGCDGGPGNVGYALVRALCVAPPQVRVGARAFRFTV